AESREHYGESPNGRLAPPTLGKKYDEDDDDLRIKDTIVEVATNYDEAVALGEKYGRYIGNALAVSCAKAGSDPDALVAEWERLTGCNAGDEGCNCCGEPHSFTWHSPEGERKSGSIEVRSRFTGFS